MTVDNMGSHAETIAAMLRALGPRPRNRILLVLRALGCSDDEAGEVVAHGLATRMFVADPADPSILRLP